LGGIQDKGEVRFYDKSKEQGDERGLTVKGQSILQIVIKSGTGV